METIACIKERRSIRTFQEKTIPNAALEELVEAARFAPSWKNTQIVRYVFLKNRKQMEEIADHCVLEFASNQRIIRGAAVLAVICYVEKRSGFERDGSFSTAKGDRWEMFDAGIAAQTFCLAAADRGIGTVMMGIFDEAKVAEAISLPEGQKVAALVAMGYPAAAPAAPKRKETAELMDIRE